MTQPFVIDEEKSLGVDDRAAERRTEIVLDEEFGAAHVAEGVGVHGAIAQKFVGRSVELIGAALGDDVDLTTASAAHFRGIAAGLHFEFLHGIWGGAEVKCVEGGIGIGGAIEEEIVGGGAIAADADGGALSGAPVEGIHGTRLGAMTDVRARNRENKVDEHATVER